MWGMLTQNERYVLAALRRLMDKERANNKFCSLWPKFTAQEIHEEIVFSNTPTLPPSESTVRKILNEWATSLNVPIQYTACGRHRQRFYWDYSHEPKTTKE